MTELQPKIIQGGMGVGVSGWKLARAVARMGQLGVVSGTGLAVVLVRRLQLGDPGGEMRAALGRFPFPAIADRIVRRYYATGGKAAGAAFKAPPMPTLKPGAAFLELTVAANFVEVFLAKEGHGGRVGINFLEKIQLPTLASVYGAMLAGVDYVLMGAGIPRSIPGVLDRFAQGLGADLRMDVQGALAEEQFVSQFDPRMLGPEAPAALVRPQFLGIVASATLAMTLARKSNGRVDGFVVEGDSAGGHNAPPRGPLTLSETGEPVYGERDVVDLEKIRALGLPFWLAGSYGRPGGLVAALGLGAAGIQAGTAFAFCAESGLRPELRAQVLGMSQTGTARVFTDPTASPTGYPFKVVQVPGTLSEAGTYAARARVCDIGYLRHLYRRPDGTVGYRCPAEPVEDYVAKGGQVDETVGRKCLCNGLLANLGLGQVRPNRELELALLTAGDEVARVARFRNSSQEDYSAADVLRYLLSEVEPDLSPEVGREIPLDSGRAVPLAPSWAAPDGQTTDPVVKDPA